MIDDGLWAVTRGEGPVVAVALHAGHALRPEVAARMRLTDAERLREEDPYTGALTGVAATTVVAHRSRFEVDLNRPRDGAVYQTPEQAWGLEVWRTPPDAALIERSLEQWDRFYRLMSGLLGEKRERYGRFVVFDVHSYNHRRDGAHAPPAAAEENPEVNVGTGSMCRSRWAAVVDGFIGRLREFGPPGCRLDVRENVRFLGGWFPRWVHETFPDAGCALALEFKKTFMDEWTGEVDEGRLRWLCAALASTVPAIEKAL